ncbi:hypothetical protein B0H14DRAFT_3170105 [Mycena olivaceomarginata]|nr:hypothetical protein B0H14DRAFT_3170105 [Mycena olivaceomarginata]
MHSLSSSKSSSTSPAACPPPALQPRRVPCPRLTALDSDALAPPLALSLRTSANHPALQRKKSVQNLHAAASSSRVRLMLSRLKKRAAALIIRRRRPSLPSSSSMSKSVGTAPSIDSALFRPYLPLAAQYERASTSAPLAFTCAPAPAALARLRPRLVRVPLLVRRLARPALAHRLLLLRHQLPLALLRYSASDRPYSFIPASTVGGPRAQWGGRIRGRGPVREGRGEGGASELRGAAEHVFVPLRQQR